MDILSALGNTLLIARCRRMARLPEIVAFAEKHRMPVLTVEDLVNYRNKKAPPL